jgi:transposase
VSHRNARSTFHGRLLIVQRYQAGWPRAHIAKAMGISRRCVSKWIARFESEGDPGLADRSSRPRSCPRRTSQAVEASIIELRHRERRGLDWIAAGLNTSARTVLRVLARHGVPHLSELDSITGELLLASKKTTVRYERARPGELVHMDVKKARLARRGPDHPQPPIPHQQDPGRLRLRALPGR